MSITLIAAVARNGVIGADGTLPWHIPADFKRVKALTMGKPLVMGRKTFESLPGLLPGRRHIVLTRDSGWQAEGAEVVHTLEQALVLAGEDAIIFGGAEIYALALPLATRLELTEVAADIPGDTHFPAIGDGWHESFREAHPSVEGRPGFTFVTLERRL